MDPALTALIGACLGLCVGAGAAWSVFRHRGDGGDVRSSTPLVPAEPAPLPAPAAEIGEVLSLLRASAVIVDAEGRVRIASPAARALGLVKDDRLIHTELAGLAREIRRDRQAREEEYRLARGPMGNGSLVAGVRAAPIGDAHVLLLIEDRTQAQRVEDVRRDFVANVSHELKTPVGGIALLAEAVLDANDDPEAVSRFARRIKIESTRLTRLVQEIVDLSRLQASQSLSDPGLVELDEVVHEAVDQMLTLAEAKSMSFGVTVERDLTVYGDAPMLVTAIGNLLSNAIAYSPEHTRVTVVARSNGDIAEIAVADRGRGISAADQQRVFERFYRVDAARSRATGGTGLGLAIVKHICANHGGEVTLWSEEGHGSTFTIRLPVASPPPPGSSGAPPHPRENAQREVTR